MGHITNHNFYIQDGELSHPGIHAKGRNSISVPKGELNHIRYLQLKY